ncbi:MAG: hypothetical protein ACR5LF_14680 [Symbiopectobacterium sp.]
MTPQRATLAGLLAILLWSTYVGFLRSLTKPSALWRGGDDIQHLYAFSGAVLQIPVFARFFQRLFVRRWIAFRLLRNLLVALDRLCRESRVGDRDGHDQLPLAKSHALVRDVYQTNKKAALGYGLGSRSHWWLSSG